MYVNYNRNPRKRNVIDCTVRAISTAMDESWDDTYWGICLQGARLCNMPSADEVWGEYLKSRGWKRRFLGDDCPICYSVDDFCREFSSGVYILGLDGHVVCVINGQLLDTWDSTDRHPIFYWEKEN